jgi:hypothetical protein
MGGGHRLWPVPGCRVVFQAVHMLMMMGFTGTNGIEKGWGPDEKRINR